MQPKAPGADRDLVLTRVIDAPREKILRAWTEPALRETHEKMGFHRSWGQATDQLAELVATL